MTGRLTYPPEIVIESTIDLPPEYGPNMEGHFELAVFVVELAFGTAFRFLAEQSR
jgi:hypothetical protein